MESGQGAGWTCRRICSGSEASVNAIAALPAGTRQHRFRFRCFLLTCTSVMCVCVCLLCKLSLCLRPLQLLLFVKDSTSGDLRSAMLDILSVKAGAGGSEALAAQLEAAMEAARPASADDFDGALAIGKTAGHLVNVVVGVAALQLVKGVTGTVLQQVSGGSNQGGTAFGKRPVRILFCACEALGAVHVPLCCVRLQQLTHLAVWLSLYGWPAGGHSDAQRSGWHAGTVWAADGVWPPCRGRDGCIL